MDERLRQAARAAVKRGLDFLEEVVASNGGWPCWRYDNTGLVGGRHLEYPPFAAALGLLAIDACDHPGARSLISRTRDFLRSCMKYPGIWSYLPGMPPAVDDTAICSLAVGPHPWLRMGRLRGRNFDVMLSHRDGDGRFLAWMPGDDWPPGLDNEVDAVVNANVLAYMGDHAETRAARRWIETVVADRHEADASPYYIEPVDLHFALARASRFRDGVLNELRPTLASRIVERLDADGGFGDAMRTAQALSALDMLVFDLDEAALAAVIERLLGAQRRKGSWPPCLAWKEPPGWAVWVAANEGPLNVRPPRGFASEAMTTAFCIEALQSQLRGDRQRPHRAAGVVDRADNDLGADPLNGFVRTWLSIWTPPGRQGSIQCELGNRLQFYIRPVRAGSTPAGLDGISPDPRLIPLEGCFPWRTYPGLAGRGMTRCHPTSSLPCVTSQRATSLRVCGLVPVPAYLQADWPAKFGSYSRSWANKAQIVRAVLFASATAATLGGRRLASRSCHADGALRW